MIGSMALVTATFVGSTIFNRMGLDNATRAVSVATNGGPSVRLLSDMRTELRRMRVAADRVAFEGDPNAASELAGASARLHAALAAELRTPEYPTERELSADVVDALAKLDHAATLLRLHEDDRARVAPRHEELNRLANQLDEKLDELHQLNAGFMLDDADALLRRERRAMGRVFWVELGCVAVTALITLLVVRILRQQFRLLEQRAVELEHFAVQVAHDMLNPLLPLHLTLDLCRGSDHSASLGSALDRSARSIERMRRSATALLAFARAGAPPAPDDAAPLRAAIEVAAESSPANARLTVEPFIDRRVAAGPAAVDAVVRSFLHESEREAAPADAIAIRVRAVDHQLRVEFHIPRTADQPAARELFAPRVRDVASGYPGIDLELEAARRIVEAHHGSLGVGDEGADHVLWFQLPAARFSPGSAA